MKARWIEFLIFMLILILTIATIVAPFIVPILSKEEYASALNIALSIETGLLGSFIFYFVVNVRLDKERRDFVRQGALRAYRDAKHNIAVAIIHASQKGGRDDLTADTETIDKILTIEGFKAAFTGGREAHEGFYAFQNQMSDHTPEYDDIVFNFRIMGRAFDRLVDANHFDDAKLYDFFVGVDSMLRRIDLNGAGYDESKLLCRFIWEIFAGWNPIQGQLDSDPIERAIEQS